MNASSAPPSKTDRPSRWVRMWHMQNGQWCHAWDVEDSAYRTWKEGIGPLSRMSVFLPDGKHPAHSSQVVCGTCRSTNVVNTKAMRQEFMRA